jgi:hypothetical protein
VAFCRLGVFNFLAQAQGAGGQFTQARRKSLLLAGWKWSGLRLPSRESIQARAEGTSAME